MANNDPWQLLTAARTLWQETRGEPDEGRRAVAHVIWNRVKSGRWGKTLGAVCLYHAQFSGWLSPKDPNFQASCNLADNDPLLQHLVQILVQTEAEPDITNGAMWYVADWLNPKPPWTTGATFKGKFGTQLFYSNVH